MLTASWSSCPFYLNPHKKAVLQHFRDIRAALDIDIMVYNNPWFAGYELNTEEVKSSSTTAPSSASRLPMAIPTASMS